MNFHKVLQNLNKETYEQLLIEKGYPEKERQEYLDFIDRLIGLTPDETEASLLLVEKNDRLQVIISEEGKEYALDFVPWEEILGYIVELEAIQTSIGVEEFCHKTLYLMSFDGFQREIREERYQELLTRIQAIKKD